MSELFSDSHRTGTVLHEWWQGLRDNKGDRAELRRCEQVIDVVTTPAYHLIYRRLLQAGLPADEHQRDRNGRLPAIIALVAHIKDKESPPKATPLAKAMSARSEGSDRPQVSPLRFRRLLELETPDDLLAGMRRVLPLIEGDVLPGVLAQDLYWWGEKVKRRWAYAYEWPAGKGD